jgi:uncharacterized repeat protein (TIGR02543 family)
MRTGIGKRGFPGTAALCAAVATLALLLSGCPLPTDNETQYTITYELNGGTNAEANPATYTAADLPLTLAAPTREGYAFEGWYAGSDLSGSAVTVIPAGNTGDKTFYAKWAPAAGTYTITYELNGGINAGANPAGYTGEDLPITLAAPTREGYAFGGWYAGSDLSGSAVTVIPAGSTGDKTFYAKWVELSSDEQTAVNGFKDTGAVKDALNAVAGNIGLDLPAADLAGIETNVDAALTAYNNLSANAKTALATEKVKLDAVKEKIGLVNSAREFLDEYWDKKVFEAGPDTLKTEEAAALFPLVNEALEELRALPEAVRDLLEEKIGRLESLKEKAEELIAGSVTEAQKAEVEAFKKTYADILAKTPEAASLADEEGVDTALAGYAGLDPVARALLSEEHQKLADLKAKIGGLKQYTIAYTLNGGTNAETNPDTYTGKDLPLTLAAPDRIGHSFGGWYADSDFSGRPVVQIPAGSTGDKAFYAKWTLVPGAYAIAYELNRGANAGSNPSAYTNADLPITLAAPTREGYAFEGWYAGSDFSGSAVTVIPADSTGDKTFYAKWKAITYTFTYKLNRGAIGGSLEHYPSPYTLEDLPFALAIPVRSNYTFGGWHEDKNFSGNAVAEIPAGSTGDKTFYAKWIPVEYTITYVLNGGINSEDNPSVYTFETPDISLADPVRAGYKFRGWYRESSFNNLVIGIIPSIHYILENLTFYARWDLIEYAIDYVLNEGTIAEKANPDTYTVESSALALAAPSRPGYTFGGWYADSDFSGSAVASIPEKSTGNKTFYAQWLPIGPARITLTIEDFASPPAPDKAEGAFDDTPIVLSKDGSPQTQDLAITGSDEDAQAQWFIGLAKIGIGASITLDAANLTVGKHTLRVTAKYDGALYSKELRFTVTE